MRRVQIVERMVVGVMAVLVLVVLVYLVIQHQRVAAVERVAAAQVAKPEAGGADCPEWDAAQRAAWQAWAAQANPDHFLDWFPPPTTGGGGGPPPGSPTATGADGAQPAAREPDPLAASSPAERLARDLLASGAPVGSLPVPDILAPDFDPYWKGMDGLAAMGEYWSGRARQDGDPGPWLDRLDALAAAFRATDDGEASWVRTRIIAERDNAYLAADVRGSLPAARRERWRAEPYDAFADWLAALERNRLRSLPAQERYEVALDPVAFARAYPSNNGWWVNDRWWHLPADFATGEAHIAAMEDVLIHRHEVQAWYPAIARLPPAQAATMRANAAAADAAAARGATAAAAFTPAITPTEEQGSYSFLGLAVLKSACEHRLAVTASRVLEVCRQGGAPPADQAALVAAAPDIDLGAGGDRLPMRYVRLGGGRFAIVVDPPLNPLFARWWEQGPGSVPATTAPCVLTPSAVVVDAGR
jgi:hypothetical protein